MKRTSITIKRSVYINKPKEIVWDYTQDYNNRPTWDNSIIMATSLLTSGDRMVKLLAKRNTIMVFVYKLDDRPHKTTLATTEVESTIIESAGGSWNYKDQDKGTLWSQTNTIVFKGNPLLPILLPIYQWVFNRQTKTAMNKVKKILEAIKE